MLLSGLEIQVVTLKCSAKGSDNSDSSSHLETSFVSAVSFLPICSTLRDDHGEGSGDSSKNKITKVGKKLGFSHIWNRFCGLRTAHFVPHAAVLAECTP